jgi:putative transcriptional regulator
LKSDGRVVRVLAGGRERALKAGVDWRRVDAATEAEIARHAAVDDAEAMRDAAAYARRVRARTRLTQAQFAARIGVPVETVRNWEQGKRSPRGPARALLRVIDRAPKAAFAALANWGR